MVLNFRNLAAAVSFAVLGGAASAATIGAGTEFDTFIVKDELNQQVVNVNNAGVGTNQAVLILGPQPAEFNAQVEARNNAGSIAGLFIDQVFQNLSGSDMVFSARTILDASDFVNARVRLLYNGTNSGINNAGKTFSIANGDSFTIRVRADDVVGVSDIDYTVEAVAIPIPAAGFLLLAGLGGLAAVRRRKTA